MKLDLHLHTTASDGLLSPTQMMEMAHKQGVSICAVTDHDTMSGIPEAQKAADSLGLQLVPGVELSTFDQVEIHILGYFNGRPEGIQQRLQELRQQRVVRLHMMLERLGEVGVKLTVEDVPVNAESAPGRMHVARALVSAGHAQSVNEAFRRYLVQGRPGYAPRDKLSHAEAIALIHDAGGLAVVAHPGIIQADPRTLPDRIRVLKQEGLDGVEVYHPRHTPTQRQQLERLARAEKLLVTGGSDHHGASGVLLPGDAMESWFTVERDCSQFLAKIVRKI